MNEHFNKLTPAEDERLALLIEECAEVIQAATKIQRHGYESHHSNNDPDYTNRLDLERELGDVRAAIDLMIRARDVRPVSINRATAMKTEKVQQFLHHQL